VYFFFDESGDYAFGEGNFDCYVQAVVICPDSALPDMEAFVRDRCSEWGVDELHASELDSARRLTIAKFLATSDCTFLVHVTDNVMITEAKIAEFRLFQAARLGANLDRYRRESSSVPGGPVAEIEKWYMRQLKRAGLASRVSDGEFIQGSFLIGLILAAFKKSLIVHMDDEWREDFHDFKFVLDAKLPGKMAAGEKYLNETLVPALGSMPNDSIITVDTWREEPVHPFVTKFSTKGGRVAGKEIDDGIDLKQVFEHGLQFERSSDVPGLQLVDPVAYVTRSAVVGPTDRDVREAYDLLRPKLRNEEGCCMTLQRLKGGQEDRSSIDRYRPLYRPRD
jgi:hypothetical protein